METIDNVSRFCVLYNGDKIVGWCATCKEAEAICEKRLDLQWDYAKKAHLGLFTRKDLIIVASEGEPILELACNYSS
jgi:hypothetical protein